MASSTARYPIRATSRSVLRKRTRRISWFAIGSTFGICCATALSPLSRAPIPDEAQMAASPPPAIIDQQIAQAPEAEYTKPVELWIAQDTPAPIDPSPTAAETTHKQDYPLNLELKVSSGDTLISMLTDAGIAHDEAHNVMQAARKFYDPKKLGIGQSMTLELARIPGDDNPIVKSLTLPTSQTSSIEVTRDGADGFDVKKVDMPVDRMVAQASGKINSSLYQTALDIGLPSAMVGEIINAYSYDVDFQRDIQPGNAINVLYERLQTKDGQTAGAGNLIFAELVMNNRALKVYRYTDKSGFTDYYNEAGESIRKALLRTPINGARISSGFGMRNHPILGYSKMHRGIDFAAPTGTPIYAAGDGVIAFAGRKGGYGNYLQVKHTGKYASAYAHLSRFASGITPGKKVKQGQIIAYVGSTGASTGPHLHYEILVNGAQVNPSGVKFKTGNVLKGKELAQFRQTVNKIEAKLGTMPKGKTNVAMADFEREVYSN